MFSRKFFLLVIVCFAAFAISGCAVPAEAAPVSPAANPTPTVGLGRTASETFFGRFTAADSPRDLITSPDGQRWAYTTQVNGKTSAVLESGAGRVVGKAYDGVYDLSFSPDGRWLAYTALTGQKMVLVVDGVENRVYDRIASYVYSPDSHSVAYEASANGKWFVVVAVYQPSADGARLSFRWDREEKQYDAIVPNSLLFGTDSLQVAYAAIMGKKQVMVIGGREGKQYDAILNVTPIKSDNSGDALFALAYTALSKDQSGQITIYTVQESFK